jgi:hypothetical protein
MDDMSKKDLPCIYLFILHMHWATSGTVRRFEPFRSISLEDIKIFISIACCLAVMWAFHCSDFARISFCMCPVGT